METDTRTDATFQGPLFAIEVRRPDNTGCVTQPDQLETIKAGTEAWSRLKKSKTWSDWLVVGEALLAIRTEAMRVAHVNTPTGARYQRECAYLLKNNRYEDGSSLEEIDKGTRSRLVECATSRKQIEHWLTTLSTTERLKLNHPEAVLRRWKKTVVRKADDPTPKSPSHVEKLKASLIESEEENAKLKREVERGGPFTRQDTAHDIAGVIYRTVLSPSKAKEIARELNRLARQTAEACV